MSQIDRRRALKFLAALGATGLASACGTGFGMESEETGSKKPVRIGMIAPKTGGYKGIGDELIKGFQTFLDLNDKRLGGHQVELVIADEGETAESGRAALASLLKQDVLALTGVVSSAVMLAIRETVEKSRIPLVGSNASPSNLQSVFYIWRTSYVNNEPGRALGPYVAEHLPSSGKVGIISPKYPGGEDAVEGFRQSFGITDPRLGEPVWTEFSPNPARNSYQEPIRELLSTDPDAIFCFFAGAAAVEFLRGLHAAGYRKQVYASGFLTEGAVLSQLKPAEAEGVMTALNYSSDLNNGANRLFATAYRKTNGTSPTTYAVASYDAAQVLDKAIRFAGPEPTPQEVNLALGKVGQVDSPRGPWQFNQPRTPQQKWYLRRVQRDGQLLSNVLINELATLG